MTEIAILAERWVNKVDFSGDCWLWTAFTNADGYGIMRYQGRNQGAHRIAWFLYRGPIPDGLELDHLCRNPRCVNPSHLEAVTHHENVKRGRLGEVSPEKARNRTQCRRGHEYTVENTYRNIQRGTRTCRQCWRASDAISRPLRRRRKKAHI